VSADHVDASEFVRPARAADVADLARIQVASWRSSYADLIPGAVLTELTSGDAEARWREQWQASLGSPPTSRHHILVAVTAAGSGPRLVAGFASCGPATDSDRWPATDAELYELRVAPDLTGRGHGSRLLNAVADTLAEDGFRTACAWALESDQALPRFLESAGWARDGASKRLDMGATVPMVRLHTTVGP